MLAGADQSDIRGVQLNSRKFQPVGIRLLLYGSPDLSDDDNVELFSYVQHFIKETNRF